MADKQIKQLTTEITSPASDDLLILQRDSDSVTGKLKISNLFEASRVIRAEHVYDHVASGGVWTGDSYGSTRVASMTAMICYINGRRISISAVVSRTFTASMDTYIDVLDNEDGTGTLVYTEVSNNAASPALVSNSIRIGIIVTGATSIANVGSINQGQTTKVLPIASSIPYQVTDSLGNLICCRDPQQKVIGYRQVTSSVNTTSATAVQITGLSIPMNAMPTLKRVKITLVLPTLTTSGNNNAGIVVYEGTVPSGTKVAEATLSNTGVGAATNLHVSRVYNPSSASVTLNAGFYINGGSTLSTNSSSGNPTYLMIERA